MHLGPGGSKEKRGERLFIDFLSRFRVVHFFVLLVVVNLLSALLLLVFPESPYVIWSSFAVHLLLVVILVWFLFRVVRPVRAGFDRLIELVNKLAVQPGESIVRLGADIGSHTGIIQEAIKLLETQYESVQSHSQQVERFSRVLEKRQKENNESRLRYRRALDALENGVYLIDDNFIIRLVNRVEAAHFNALPKDLVGEYCYRAFRKRETPCPDCLPRECLQDGLPRKRLRVLKRRAGRECVNIHCYPIRHEDDQCCHEVVIYVQDTSALVALEDRVIESEKMASIGQMAAGIAHDLNNYLAGIFGAIQLLQMYAGQDSEPDRKKEGRLLQRLQTQVEALNLMVANLMVFAHPERKEFFPLSLNEVVKKALSFSRYELERDHVQVVLDLAADLPLVKCEKNQLQQVMLNLLLNAAQAIRARRKKVDDDFSGEIVVTTGRASGESLFFSIADNGIGIDSECQEYIFDPFYTTRHFGTRGGATGLGLFTARVIVEQHQGTINLSSLPGWGSRFEVLMPLHRDENSCEAIGA